MATGSQFNDKKTVTSGFLTFDDFQIDVDRCSLSKGGALVDLPTQPLRLLILLVSNAGKIVTHEEIRSHLWGDRIVDFSTATHVAVRKIRNALGDDSGTQLYVQTVPSVGYKFLPQCERSNLTDVESVPPPASFDFRKRVVLAGVLFACVLIGSAGVSHLASDSAAPKLESNELSLSPAEDPYRRGRYLLDQGTTAGAEQSLEFFRRAIEADADFALAHAAMAEAYQQSGEFENARLYAARALAVDPELADAHLRLGAVAFFQDQDWGAASQYIERALALNPDLVEAHHAIATVYSITGRIDVAIDHMQRALSLDPASTLLLADHGYFLKNAGRYSEAAEQCSSAIELDPDHRASRLCLIETYAEQGDFGQSGREAVNYLVRFGAGSDEIEWLRSATGKERVRRFFEWRLTRYDEANLNPTDDLEGRAMLHASLGAHDTALELLEESKSKGSRMLPLIVIDSTFKQMHGDRRFRDFARSLSVVLPTNG